MNTNHIGRKPKFPTLKRIVSVLAVGDSFITPIIHNKDRRSIYYYAESINTKISIRYTHDRINAIVTRIA